jgi:hypothetical protein
VLAAAKRVRLFAIFYAAAQQYNGREIVYLPTEQLRVQLSLSASVPAGEEGVARSIVGCEAKEPFENSRQDYSGATSYLFCGRVGGGGGSGIALSSKAYSNELPLQLSLESESCVVPCQLVILPNSCVQLGTVVDSFLGLECWLKIGWRHTKTCQQEHELDTSSQDRFPCNLQYYLCNLKMRT